MSFGKMNQFITICRKTITTDAEGFQKEKDAEVAKVRAYREGRHGSERWTNLAAFSDATELFRFRVIPKTTITEDMVIISGEERFEIESVENVKGKNMYLEVLCREVKASG